MGSNPIVSANPRCLRIADSMHQFALPGKGDCGYSEVRRGDVVK